MAKKEKSELKKLAAEAKKRLTSGYWKKIQEERDAARLAAIQNGKDPKLVCDFMAERCTTQIAAVRNAITGEEEALYQRVCELLDCEEDIINPVSRLIDHRLYDTMSASEKQRYTLSLMSRYCEMKERYTREKMLMNIYQS